MPLHNSDSKENKEEVKLMVQRKVVVPIIQKGKSRGRRRGRNRKRKRLPCSL